MQGLTASEVHARLKAEGFNELPRAGRRTIGGLILEVLREPMLLLLLAGGVIYFVLGDLGEALLLLVFASVSIVITIVQEARTERVLESLRDLTSPRALVIRDGDRVAADAVVVRSDDLLLDESLLTGESVPVRKRAQSPLEKPVAPAAG